MTGGDCCCGTDNLENENEMHLPYAKLGSISHGTLRTEHLLDAFANHLLLLCGDNKEHKKIAEEAYEIVKNWDDSWDADKLQDIEELLWVDLFEALQEYAPPYSYFGSHIGDGSDYGFWICGETIEEAIRGGERLDPENVKTEEGYIIHVNERGNVTLYSSDNEDRVEIWSIV